MAVLHTIGSESHQNGNLRLELFDSDFGGFSNFEDVGQLFISEVSYNLTHGLVCIIDDFFNLPSVDLVERIIKPRVVALSPLLDDCPKLVEELEVLLHLVDRSVVSDLLVSNQILAVVDHLSVVITLVQTLLDVLGHLSNLLELLGVGVLLERASKVFKLGDLVIEIFLVVLHLLYELFFLLLKEALLLLNA